MTTSANTSIGYRLANSMWAFWLTLLTGSMALATVIYYVWLKGNL
jgi:hypothetical protein